MPKKPLPLLIGIVVLFVGVYFLAQWKPGPELTTRQAATTCVTHEQISFHIHPTLKIVVNGEQAPIPADIGITQSCMGALHTHTADGVIHVEYGKEMDFTLGDFFAVWKKSLSATQVLEYVADDVNKVTMTVNGTEVDTFENTILRDKDEIVITYGP